MTPDEARQLIPESAVALFDDIRFSRVLGATRHADMIGSMLQAIAQHATDGESLTRDVSAIATYFQETRGAQTRAVHNAVRDMVVGLDQARGGSVDIVRDHLNANIERYRRAAKESVSDVVQYTVNLTAASKSVLAFDYSSTVAAVLEALPDSVEIVIAESRALDGGRPFLTDSLLDSGKTIRFVSDATLYQELSDGVSAAIIGVESFYPDGTVFNTVGSDILGILCREAHVPLYAVTPMNKLDERGLYGIRRNSPMPYDFRERLTAGWEPAIAHERVDFTGRKLVSLAPSTVTAIVTEVGVIPPAAMLSVSRSYLAERA